MVPDFPSDDPYVVYCFNEAVALAGLSLYTQNSDNSDESTQEEPIRQINKRISVQRAPRPDAGAVIGVTATGVPFISGKVAIQRKKS